MRKHKKTGLKLMRPVCEMILKKSNYFFLMAVTTNLSFALPIAATANALLISFLEEEKVTFWVFGLSPLEITISVALNLSDNAARTYFLQPAQVTPVICAMYAVVFASLSAAVTKPMLRAKTPIIAMNRFFIFNYRIRIPKNSNLKRDNCHCRFLKKKKMLRNVKFL